MTADSPSRRILLVTGMSGAGKTTALHVLEDLGWETVDNFPIRMLSKLVGKEPGPHIPLAVGFDTRTRGFAPRDIIDIYKKLAASDDIELTTLYIDCSTREIERRYNETRRPHPMARDRPIGDGIRAERELLEPLRRWADMVIDTSTFSSHELQEVIRDRFDEGRARDMLVTVSSFGFARGMPPLADLMFDMRFLNNPHWVPGLREQTGLDPDIADYITGDPAFEPAFGKIADTLLELLPRYVAQRRGYLNIAFGCTGGRHRSVYSAERAAQVLREAGFSPTVLHRNLGSRPADPLERR